MSKEKYAGKPETDKGFSVFKTFKEDADVIRNNFNDNTINPDEAVISMSSLGDLGRFGNQLLQYAFVRVCAKKLILGWNVLLG